MADQNKRAKDGPEKEKMSLLSPNGGVGISQKGTAGLCCKAEAQQLLDLQL